ncbi:hypothetical protein BST61_g1404 [Cercospora zeina]
MIDLTGSENTLGNSGSVHRGAGVSSDPLDLGPASPAMIDLTGSEGTLWNSGSIIRENETSTNPSGIGSAAPRINDHTPIWGSAQIPANLPAEEHSGLNSLEVRMGAIPMNGHGSGGHTLEYPNDPHVQGYDLLVGLYFPEISDHSLNQGLPMSHNKNRTQEAVHNASSADRNMTSAHPANCTHGYDLIPRQRVLIKESQIYLDVDNPPSCTWICPLPCPEAPLEPCHAIRILQGPGDATTIWRHVRGSHPEYEVPAIRCGAERKLQLLLADARRRDERFPNHGAAPGTVETQPFMYQTGVYKRGFRLICPLFDLEIDRKCGKAFHKDTCYRKMLLHIQEEHPLFTVSPHQFHTGRVGWVQFLRQAQMQNLEVEPGSREAVWWATFRSTDVDFM